MYTLSNEELQLLSSIHPTLRYNLDVKTSKHEFKNDKVKFTTITHETDTFVVKDRVMRSMDESVKANFAGDINVISFSYLPKTTSPIEFVTPDAKEHFKHSDGSAFLLKGTAYRLNSYVILPPFTTMRHIVILVKPPLLVKLLKYDLSFYKHIENELSKDYYEFAQSHAIYGNHKLNGMFADIMDTKLTGGMYKLFVETNIFQMFLEIFASSIYTNNEYSNTAYKISEYLKENIEQKKSMKDFEILFNTSRYKINKEFQEMFNMSINQYQKRLRYEKIKSLLNQGMSYSKIAKKLNYTNQTHLKNFIDTYMD